MRGRGIVVVVYGWVMSGRGMRVMMFRVMWFRDVGVMVLIGILVFVRFFKFVRIMVLIRILVSVSFSMFVRVIVLVGIFVFRGGVVIGWFVMVV